VEPAVKDSRLLRLANSVLRLVLSEPDYEGIAGDLAEEYASARLSKGAFRASLWYWGEVIFAVGSEIRTALRGASEGWAFGWSKDVRYALRQLGRSPGFTLAVILTFALGIGANAAIFSFVNALLVRPFPFPNPDRLVAVYGLNSSDKSPLSMRELTDLNERAQLFEGFAGYNDTGYNYGGDGGPAEHFIVTRATSNLFRILGVEPILGGTWPPDRDKSRSFEIVLTQELWTRRFHSDPSIVGKQVLMDGFPNTVVGIAPPGFAFPFREALFRCWGIDRDPKSYEERHRRMLFVVGRLKPGVAIAQGREEIAAIGLNLAQEFPLTNSNIRLGVAPLRDAYMGDVRPYLLLLLGAVGFVLMIACANAANLLLAHAAGQKRDMAIRTALGASRARLIRQILVETLLYSVIGGMLGVGMAQVASRVLRQMISVELPAWMDVRIDAAVVLYLFCITVVAALLAGILPSVRGTRRDMQPDLKQGAAVSSKPARLLGPVVTAEVAFASVLLIGTGLMMQSFAHLMNVDLGFRTDHLFTFNMGLSWRKYNLQGARQLETRVLEELAKIPGVVAAELDTALPLSGEVDHDSIRLEGQSSREEAGNPLIAFHQVSENYHQMMGIPLIEGRHFNQLDHESSLKVAIVNERLAKRLWPGEDPIGKKVLPGDALRPWTPEWLTIVGIVGNIKASGPASDVELDVYVPYLQIGWQSAHFAVRTSQDPASIHKQVLRAVANVDPEEPPNEMLTMDQVLHKTIWQRKLAGVVFTMLGGLALLLSAIGIYSVIAYSVSQRVREIGIRSALGAGRADILRMIAAEGARFILPGIASGVFLGLALGRAVSALLFQISPYDPLTLAGVIGGLCAVAALACIIPASRAARIDPLVALRTD
jgi:predicted permease